MFSISFLDRYASGKEAIGEIVIGHFRERFVASLAMWTPAQYEESWRGGLSRIIRGAATSALVTNMQDPAYWAHLEWWVLYREGKLVYVQNQILVYENLSEPFRVKRLYSYIPERKTASDDGEPVSEWRVSLATIIRQ